MPLKDLNGLNTLIKLYNLFNLFSKLRDKSLKLKPNINTRSTRLNNINPVGCT